MSVVDLFPRRRVVAGPKHRASYDVVTDILRKNAPVVRARHSSDPDSMRAVFPR